MQNIYKPEIYSNDCSLILQNVAALKAKKLGNKPENLNNDHKITPVSNKDSTVVNSAKRPHSTQGNSVKYLMKLYRAKSITVIFRNYTTIAIRLF